MSISKLSSPAFKGTLSFFNPKAKDKFQNSMISFDTVDIDTIVDSKDHNTTIIIGRELRSGKNLKYKVPYNAVSPEEIMAAYTAAKQSKTSNVNISSSKLTTNLALDILD